MVITGARYNIKTCRSEDVFLKKVCSPGIESYVDTWLDILFSGILKAPASAVDGRIRVCM